MEERNEANTRPFSAPSTTPENMLFLRDTLQNIQKQMFEDRKNTNTKLEHLSESMGELRSSVDRLGIDHLLGGIDAHNKELDFHDERIKKLEGYHNKVLGIVAFAGFSMGLVSTGVIIVKTFLS